MSRTGAQITSTVLVLLKLFAVPLAAVAIGAAVWLIFGNWSVPLIAAAVVLLLLVLNMARPRNNVLIAHNVAFSHTYLRNQYSSILDSDDLLLLVTGMVATTPYLNNGKLSLEDIVGAVRHAKENRIFLMGSHRFIYKAEPIYGKVGPAELQSFMSNMELFEKKDILLNLTLNIQALELAADNPSRQISPGDVMQAVLGAKEQTYKAMDAARSKPTPSGIAKTADSIMQSPDLDQLRNLTRTLSEAAPTQQ